MAFRSNRESIGNIVVKHKNIKLIKDKIKIQICLFRGLAEISSSDSTLLICLLWENSHRKRKVTFRKGIAAEPLTESTWLLSRNL